jgi:hypothetical protein
MTQHRRIDVIADLPPLWDSEARETGEIILPLRFRCPWHALTWYPVERDGDILFGLTTRIVPEWRHFDVSEIMGRHHGHPVVVDRDHRPAPVPQVPHIRDAHLADITPFVPSKVRLP